MDFEDMQKAWQAQVAMGRVTISAETLLKEVRRNQRQFWVTIFWRDVREVGVALVLGLFSFHRGARNHDWTDYLTAWVCLGVGAFMIVDRVLQRRNLPMKQDSLSACVNASLVQVDHQIWLLENVMWWYLLPLAAAIALSLICSPFHALRFDATHWLGSTTLISFSILLFWGIYRLNHAAVGRNLRPRRQELMAILEDLRRP